MTKQRWWRQAGGLPPRVARRRERALTPLAVWLNRLALLIPVAVVLWGLLGNSWYLAAIVVPATAFSLWAMPEHQRRQVFHS